MELVNVNEIYESRESQGDHQHHPVFHLYSSSYKLPVPWEVQKGVHKFLHGMLSSRQAKVEPDDEGGRRVRRKKFGQAQQGNLPLLEGDEEVRQHLRLPSLKVSKPSTGGMP